MSADTLPTEGRVALATKLAASKFLFALSSGLPAWDSQWTTPTPPTPPLDATNVKTLIGYARPTITDYLKPDPSGTIGAETGAKFSVSADPTRYLRVRLSLPIGAYAGATLREIALFVDPEVNSAVAPGQILIAASDVITDGRLLQLHWREPLPLEDGDFFARNFILKV